MGCAYRGFKRYYCNRGSFKVQNGNVKQARHARKVMPINELFCYMENGSGISVGATNFVKNLASTTLRHFTPKIEADYLCEAETRFFSKRQLRVTLNDVEFAEQKRIPMFVPGVFRTVRRSISIIKTLTASVSRIITVKI